MLNFKIEHIDVFSEEEAICWLQATNVEKPYIAIAKQMDQENFLEDCFGVCVNYSKTDSPSYCIVQDNPECELYYIDNNGDKNWLEYILSEEEVNAAIVLCSNEVPKEIKK